MPTFCFIANNHLTPLQIEIARRLVAKGVKSCFIAVNSRLVGEIATAGFPQEYILHLTFDPGIDEPVFVEVPIRFNDLVLADRALRHLPEKGLRFLNRAARQIYAFLQHHSVDFVFSEATWAHERLAAALCAASSGQCRFLTPFTVRYPADRWAFFEGGDQPELYPINNKGIAHKTELTTILDAGPPAYLKRNDELLLKSQRLIARINRVRRFLTRENIEPLDPTHIHSRWQTLRVMGSEEINRFRFRLVNRKALDETMLSSPFVVYALHKQPEASIDVLGRYYEDQHALILAIWRSLPPGWKLFVKEHTNAIGDRPPSFYRNLSRWPNLDIINEKTPMPLLLRHARAVFTVSGTVAYEAALGGVPSFTFAPMFFNAFGRSRRITIEDLRRSRDIAALIEELPRHDEQAAEQVLASITAHSFPGKFTDVLSDPSVISPQNLDKLLKGFLELAPLSPEAR